MICKKCNTELVKHIVNHGRNHMRYCSACEMYCLDGKGKGLFSLKEIFD